MRYVQFAHMYLCILSAKLQSPRSAFVVQILITEGHTMYVCQFLGRIAMKRVRHAVFCICSSIIWLKLLSPLTSISIKCNMGNEEGMYKCHHGFNMQYNNRFLEAILFFFAAVVAQFIAAKLPEPMNISLKFKGLFRWIIYIISLCFQSVPHITI